MLYAYLQSRAYKSVLYCTTPNQNSAPRFAKFQGYFILQPPKTLLCIVRLDKVAKSSSKKAKILDSNTARNHTHSYLSQLQASCPRVYRRGYGVFHFLLLVQKNHRCWKPCQNTLWRILIINLKPSNLSFLSITKSKPPSREQSQRFLKAMEMIAALLDL